MTATHLSEKARAALDLPVNERKEYVQRERWIGYPRALEIIKKLEDLLAHPPKRRMPNLLIVGETNNGKTTVVDRFCSKHPEYDNPEGDGITLPVLSIQAPPSPDEGRFYNTILEKIHAPYKPNDRVDKKQFQSIRILSQTHTRMLILDEFHHIIAGNTNKQRNFLNTVKYLGNELQIPLVGVGTRLAFNALHTDEQLSNRFEPMILPRWKMGKEYLQLLASFECMLPLKKPSKLAETETALKLLSMSEATIGELSTILVTASIKAIEDETECITKKLLNSIRWVQPSERKRAEKQIA